MCLRCSGYHGNDDEDVVRIDNHIIDDVDVDEDGAAAAAAAVQWWSWWTTYRGALSSLQLAIHQVLLNGTMLE